MTEKPTYSELEEKLQESENKIHALEQKIKAYRADEAGLQASEEKFRELVESSINWIYEMDAEGIYTYASPQVKDLLGYSPDEVLGKTIFDFLAPSETDRVAGVFGALLENPEPINFFEKKCIHRDGHEVVIESNGRPILDSSGNLKGFRGIKWDITDRKRAEKALRESEALFKLITENTSALVAIFDSRADYIFASPSHEQLGYRSEDLIGKSGFTLLEKETAVELVSQLERAKSGEVSKANLEYKLMDKEGNIRDFRGSFDAIFRPDGALEKIVCVGEEITELKKAQIQREEAVAMAAESKKMALVGQVAGKIAHDFNNILGIIMGNAELSMDGCQSPDTKKSFELIFDQTLRGKNLTKNLVAFAKDQEPRQDYVNINEKLALVVTLMKKDLRGIHVTEEYDRQNPKIFADSGMIEHALVNVLQNAVHATSLVKKPLIQIRTICSRDQVHIEIQDNGCGIPKDCSEKIFDPWFTLKGSKDKTGSYKPGIEGTGYGLANVKKYVEQHKGKLSISSKPQNGTTVTISLAVIKKEAEDVDVIESPQNKGLSEKYILVVEDEKAILDIQYRALTNAALRHKVDVACNGKTAMTLVSKNNYDCISLDYLLPGKENGMDIYHHIREKTPTTPILFISGNIEFLESIKELMKQDPYVDHLSKPCQNKEYIKSISRLLGSVHYPSL